MNKCPIIVQVVVLTLWSFAGICEEAFMVFNFTDLESYKNVTGVVVVNNFQFVLDVLLYSTMAYVLFRMSGSRKM